MIDVRIKPVQECDITAPEIDQKIAATGVTL